MRGGLPALFVFQVLVLRRWHREPRPGVRWWIGGLLVLGALNSGLEYRRHVRQMVLNGSWRDDAKRLPVQSLFQLQRGIYHRPGFDFSRQYLGAADGVYARYLAPPNRPAPRVVER